MKPLKAPLKGTLMKPLKAPLKGTRKGTLIEPLKEPDRHPPLSGRLARARLRLQDIR